MASMPTINGVRARRFPLRVPVQYRAAGEQRWHRGVSENVSCSGILLRGRHALPRSAKVEVMMPIPRQLSGKAQVRVLCHGQVARTLDRPLPLLRSGMAVSVADYRLLNGRREVTHARALEERLRGIQVEELAHGLNDMLAVVIGGSELMLSFPGLDARLQQTATAVRTAGQRAATLVQQLTTWKPR